MLEPSLADPESVYGNNARLGDGQAWPNAEVKSNENGQLCRVCANGGDYFIPIFDGQGLEHKLEEKICKHLPIKVSNFFLSKYCSILFKYQVNFLFVFR